MRRSTDCRSVARATLLLVLPAFLAGVVWLASRAAYVSRPPPGRGVAAAEQQASYQEVRGGRGSPAAAAAPPRDALIGTLSEALAGNGCTTPAPVGGASIRVNLTPHPQREMILAVDGPFRLRTSGASEVVYSAGRLRPTRVRWDDDGLWFDGMTLPVDRVEIVPDCSAGIWIHQHLYRGRVELIRRSGHRLIAVNVLPLEAYLVSVLDGEMPASFPPAARQAQAIAARTYALWQMRGHPDFDVYATERSQRYLGAKYVGADGRLLAGETAAAREIVSQTRGLVCVHDGRLFCTYYTAVCGGRTTPGRHVFPDAAPPLAAVRCTWCRDAPLFRWTRTVARSELEQRLSRFLARRKTAFATLSAIGRDPTAAGVEAAIFRIEDGERRHSVSAVEFRRHVLPQVLPSPRFDVEFDGEECRFHGCGSGHGVGLCQWGARGMARAGHDCAEILAHYYPGARLCRIHDARTFTADRGAAVPAAVAPSAGDAATPAPAARRGTAPAAGAQLR